MEWALPLPLLKSLVVDLNLNMPRPFQVKGVRVDMPRPFQVKGVRVDMPRMSHYSGLQWAIPAFPVLSRPLMWLSECIIFTFVRDIRDKDMKSDINIRKQTASKLETRDGNVWTRIVVQNLGAGPQFFPGKKWQTSIMFVWFLKSMAHSTNLQCRT
jgi:hypothetical protein